MDKKNMFFCGSSNDLDFRSLNYLGSKLRILDFIEKNINTITSKDKGVCDLFAGSGCVSYRLSHNRKIVASDIQEYSRIICSALLEKQTITKNEIKSFIQSLNGNSYIELLNVLSPLNRLEEKALFDSNMDILSNIIENGSLEVFMNKNTNSKISEQLMLSSEKLRESKFNNINTLMTRYFGGVYFSYKQAIQIDIILQTIDNFPIKHKDILLASLIGAVSDTVNTVGKQFAQPIKPFDSKGNIKYSLQNKLQKDRAIDVFHTFENWLYKYYSLERQSIQNLVLRADYIDCLKSLPQDIETIYADPPYTRDHYSRYYHVLETMVLRDAPTISKVKIRGEKLFSRGIYREDRYQSPFCIKTQAPIAFEEMFKEINCQGKKLVLSYSPYDETKKTHPRVVTMSTLVDLASNYFKTVNVISAGQFNHNKLNSAIYNLEASNMAESLIICY